ncbi:MFS transporter [Pseudothermotoga elfii]
MIDISIFASLAHFISDFYVSFLTPLGPYFMDKYQITAKQIAFFITAISFISSVFQIFFGIIADNVKDRFRFIYLLTATTIFLISLIDFAHSIVTLFILFLVAYFANSAFHPAGASLSHSVSERGMPIFVSAGTIGAALGPVFVTAFSSFNLKHLWIIGLPLLALLALFIKPERAKYTRPDKPKEKFHFSKISTLMDLWIMVTMRTLIMSVVHLYAPILSVQRGYSLIFGGSLLSIGIAVGVFTTVLGAWISKKIGNNLVNFASFLGMSVALFMLITSSSAFSTILSYTLIDAFGYLTMSSNVTQAQITLPNHTSFASSFVMGFAWACGTGLRFFLIMPFGDNITIVFYTTAFISIAMAIFTMTWHRIKSKKQPLRGS